MPYKNPKEQRAYHEKYRQRIKREAMEAFGGECIVCGTKNLTRLHLIHPNGDGNEHRKLLGTKNIGKRSGFWFYLALRKREWNTDGFEVAVMCQTHHNMLDFSGQKSAHWGKKNEEAVGFKPKSTNPMTKYQRYRRDPERFSMTDGDWQQLREYQVEKYHQRKGVEV